MHYSNVCILNLIKSFFYEQNQHLVSSEWSFVVL